MPVQFAGSSFAAEEATGKAVAPAGIALDVVGAAALAAGVTLLIWHKVTDKPARAWLTPTSNGLAVGGRF